ncbi:MAG TPA: hypothetical protein VM510_14270 [Caulifigura sp.]|jgi:hypothetical protein|nr:hypothetical protein [Caulifigura sp.]
MSSIDPAILHSRTNSITGLESQNFDPATVLLALSLGQMGILQESLLTRVPSTKDDVDRLGRIASSSSQLQKLNDSALKGEQEEADALLKQIESFKSKHVTGDESKLVVNDAEQQELARASEWAQQRGFLFPELTKQVPVPKPPKSETETESETKAEGDEAAAEEPVEMQTVIDEQQFLGIHEAMKAYIDQLKTGNVDNPAIRSRLSGSSGFAQLADQVRELGVGGILNTPQGIHDAVGELESQYNQIQKAAQQAVGELKILLGHVDQTASGLTDLNRSQLQTDSRATDRKADDERQRIQNLDLDKNREAQLTELADVVQAAERALEQLAVRQDLARDLARDLPVSAQVDVQTQLSNWQQALNKQLESNQQAPRPEQRFRPASAYV